MSTDRDMTRIVRSWLRTDEHESADRVLDNVLALLDATPQRRSMWPARRIADMNSVAKLATAVAAVVVAAVVGINLLPGGVGPGDGPSPSPSPSLSPSPSPSPTAPPQPSASSIAFPPVGAVTAGRHTFTEDGIVFSLQVPALWYSSGLNCGACAPDAGWLERGAGVDGDPDTAWMPIWGIDGVASDPCAHTPAPVATSAAELAAGVAALPGMDVLTDPEDVTVGGRPAKHVVIKLREDIECAPGSYNMWYDDDAGSPIFRWATVLGQTNEIWIVDVGGSRVWIEAETYEGASPELEQEIQAMIDSIQFE
jgi:hypothetical protein